MRPAFVACLERTAVGIRVDDDEIRKPGLGVLACPRNVKQATSAARERSFIVIGTGVAALPVHASQGDDDGEG